MDNSITIKSINCQRAGLNNPNIKIQSINQSILFLIKRYIINALSAVQWNTHISLNTYIHIQ